MSLILAIGTNQGNRLVNLKNAIVELEEAFTLLHKSRIYESQAVDYLDQPDFLNQVLQFTLPELKPLEVLKKCLDIEQSLGRQRIIDNE